MGGWPGKGNIDADPLFVHVGIRDLHLTHPSPCRNAGDNSATGLSPEDHEGDPRIAHGTVDIGADEFYTHLYYTGYAEPGGSLMINLVGLPYTQPVGLWFGSGVLDPPLPSMWGDWYLDFPIKGPIDLGMIPSSGVLVLDGTVPGSTPAPASFPMQALIGTELTNLCILEIEE
jgi:hypothetical protein